MSEYDYQFYKNRDQATINSARSILGNVFNLVGVPTNVVDFGCGVGTWLKVSKELGATNTVGFDGPYVDSDLLEIDPADFHGVDLTQLAPSPTIRSDLAISLEVAEHLPTDCAASFVNLLTSTAPIVLFSAAIPGPGGVGHINCQWPSYWIALFEARGFACFDVIRPLIWKEKSIPNCYRNNAMLFVQRDMVRGDRKFEKFEKVENFGGADLVHPEYFEHRLHRMGILASLGCLKRAIGRKFLNARYSFVGKYE